jgi:beta-N-acetylhexosaminidase
MLRILFSLLLLVPISCSSSRQGAVPPQQILPVPSHRPSRQSWADSVLSGMTLEQKAGQLLMVIAYGVYQSPETGQFARLERLVHEQGIGGVILSHGDLYESARLLNRLQSLAAIPLLVGSDLERGLSMRVRRGTPFPDCMALGATRNPEYAYRIGRAIAEEARAIGIHQNYAPVADVNTNPLNPVINTRSFGDNVALVDGMVKAFVRGTEEGGVIATAKHFPGHGDTGRDSHLELPLLTLDRARLDSVELSPFRAAIESGARSVMIGHLNVPALEKDGSLPASLSRRIIGGVLEREMGFSGLVVSDAMEMRGVTQGYSIGQSTVMAIQAGTDLVLLPPNADLALEAIVSAVRGGTLAESRIDEAARKILRTKQALGLDRDRLVNEEEIAQVVGNPEHWRLAREAARDAVTLLRDDVALLPLREESAERPITVVLTDAEQSRVDVERPGNPFPCEATGAYLTRLLRSRLGRLESVGLSPASSQEDFDDALRKVRRSDLILVQTYVKVRTSSGSIGLPTKMKEFLAAVEDLHKPLVALVLGSPYVASLFPGADVLLCTYGDSEPLVEAAAEALCGEIPIRGKLPISIEGAFTFGSGIRMRQLALRHVSATDAGFDALRMSRIDSIAYAGIADSAFSAAQIAVVYRGALAWDRSYGTYTYDARSREIDDSSLFDLASLTKVVGTTSAIMKLYEQGKIALDDPVSKYIPAFTSGLKAAITIRLLLLHRGGFPPFRKFWEFCPTPAAMLDSVFATPLVARPGDTTIYSDLGFITLGKIVEKVSGMPLTAYLQKEFFGPLGMGHTMYTPPVALRLHAVPTEVDTVWRQRLIQGTVHDENADFLGGVSGHAGLFSTAGDLARYVQMLLNGGTYDGIRFLNDTTIARFVRKRVAGQERYLGWDMKSPKGSSAGRLFSATSFGHTGFTGTSIWIDPERALAVIFLTNRVHPTRANTKLFRIRPALHDAVVSALLETPRQ